MGLGIAEEKRMDDAAESELYQRDTDAHKRLRSRRKRRRAYIRSIYLLPSMATLGNALCGFAAIYIASLDGGANAGRDPWTQYFAEPAHRFTFPAYLIFLAMFFDAIDGRLARFTRHTTDFGGQLDSMADVISFGIAPAILMLQLCRFLPNAIWTQFGVELPFIVTRVIWAIGAIYACCAAIRLARFNVSNQHGEQHHFSFLGLPSPAAGAMVAAMALMCCAILERWTDLYQKGTEQGWIKFYGNAYVVSLAVLPIITLAVGLLMVSTIRYPHLVNRYLRGRKTVPQLVGIIIVCLAVLVAHQYVVAVAVLIYVLWGLFGYFMGRIRKRPATVTAK